MTRWSASAPRSSLVRSTIQEWLKAQKQEGMASFGRQTQAEWRLSGSGRPATGD